MKTVDEANAFTVTARFRNGTAGTTPNTAHYRVDCRTTKREILGWTPISPSSVISIDVLPEWNAILDSSNLVEQKTITVAANKDTSGQRIRSYTWEVKNLQGVF